MLKEDILRQAKEQGITLTNSMFERYVEFGLIVSSIKDGRGYIKGVQTHYHERTMDSMLFIEELKSSKKFGHQKNYIFILYWKGYPIDWYKLKTRLIEFHISVMESFKVIAEYSTKPEYKELIDDIAEDEAKSVTKTIGRPSKQSIEVQRKEAQETANRLILVGKMISGIFNNGTISQDVFNAFNQQTRANSEFVGHLRVSYPLGGLFFTQYTSE